MKIENVVTLFHSRFKLSLSIWHSCVIQDFDEQFMHNLQDILLTSICAFKLCCCLIPIISPDCQQMSTATLLVHRSPFYWYSGKTRFWQKDLLWFLCKQIASFSLFIHRSVNKMRYQLYVYVIKDTLILWHKVSLFWQPWNGMNITTSSILNKLLKEVLSSW